MPLSVSKARVRQLQVAALFRSHVFDRRNVVSCCGRLFGVDSSDRSAGKDSAQQPSAEADTPARAWRGRAGVRCQGPAAAISSRQSVTQEHGHGLGKQHLAAMRDIHDARGAVDFGVRRSRCRGARLCRRAGRIGRAAQIRIRLRLPRSRRWYASVASIASSGSANTAWMPSPVIFTRIPLWLEIVSRAILSCRASAGRICSGPPSTSGSCLRCR